MGWKVCAEIGNYIFEKHKLGYKPKEILEMVRNKYGLTLHRNTLYNYKFPYEEVQQNFQIQYLKRSENQQKRMREYKREHSLLSSNFDKFLFYFFNRCEQFSLDEIKSRLHEISSIKLRNKGIKRILRNYEDKYGQSPVIDLGDGYFELNKNYNSRRIRPPPYLWASMGEKIKAHYPKVKLINR
jgi:hypothetical protein